MDQPQTSLKPRILLSPLDWGLGHATRSIPIIKELLFQNADVVLAGEGKIKKLLEKEFPRLPFAGLKGYDISYSKNKWTLPFAMAAQIPKIISVIEEENQRIDEIVEEYAIDGIISDNRYGLYHDTLPSVLITHQLLIKTNMGKRANELLQKINYRFINKFTECWVPDYENENNLAGELSHPSKLPGITTRWLGPLSRLEYQIPNETKHLLVLLSGPEPQRTILEEMLIQQLENYNDPVVFVRGLPGEINNLKASSNIQVFDHLTAGELNKYLPESHFVIARCGYSTVMDLAALKKKSILIPTPGQTEQEYLAKHLMQKNFALCIEQQKFRLKAALMLAENFPFQLNHYPTSNTLRSTIEDFLYKIGSMAEK